MPSRRSHTNSHHGCLQCKAKRVKCDQLQPKCSRCERTGSECTYRHLMTSYNPFQEQPSSSGSSSRSNSVASSSATLQNVGPTSSRGSASPGTSAISPAAPFMITNQTPMSMASPATQPLDVSAVMHQLPPLTDPNDIYLLNHYLTNLTGSPMSPILPTIFHHRLNGSIMNNIRRSLFVRNVVISYAAMHLASINAPSSPGEASSSPNSGVHNNLLSAAFAHKDAALRLFLPAVGAGIDSSSAEPLLAASCVLVACELALPYADPHRRTAYDRIDILAHVAGLLQGSSHFFYQTSSHAPAASTSPSSSGAPSPPLQWSAPPDDFPWSEAYDSVAQVKRVIDGRRLSDPTLESRRPILSWAAHKLCKYFYTDPDTTVGNHNVCAWLGMFRNDFVDCIHERDPMALVLLAHWIVSARGTDGVWWADGWPAAACSAICEELEAPHRQLIGWCTRYTM